MKPHPLKKLFFQKLLPVYPSRWMLCILKLSYIIKKGKFFFPWLRFWVLVGLRAAPPGHLNPTGVLGESGVEGEGLGELED